MSRADTRYYAVTNEDRAKTNLIEVRWSWWRWRWVEIPGSDAWVYHVTAESMRWCGQIVRG